MPSFFKGGSFRRGRTKEAKTYENLDVAPEQDPFSDVEYYKNETSTMEETYTGGPAPVVISIDDTDESIEQDPESPNRPKSKQEPIQRFTDETNGDDKKPLLEEPSPTKVGSGDLEGKMSDLDFCCIKDGAIDCMGLGDSIVVCEGDKQERYIQVEPSQKIARDASMISSIGVGSQVDVVLDDNEDETEKIRSICPVRGSETDIESTEDTAFSQQLDTIRCIGPIRDGSEKKGVKDYLNQCVGSTDDPSSSKKGGFSGKNLVRIMIMLAIAIVAVIAGVVVLALRRKGNKAPNGEKSQITGSQDPEVARMYSLLDLTPASDWEIEGSPQNLALEWILNEDPAQLSAETAPVEELRERFAAATLYFATGGPESWTVSPGFLSGDSICNWNDEVAEESIGIFCGDGGRVNKINIVSNNLTGSMPNELNYFMELLVLNLYYNKLTGPIPDLSYLMKLTQLDLDGNELSGTAPESLFNLPSIVNLFLLNNKELTGTIPEILDSSKLEKISLLGCSFTGTIPKSLGKLSALRLLQLKGNEIEGSIPADLLSSPTLQTLGLDSNKLTGNIPSVTLTESGSVLKSLSLGSNSLDGSFPNGFEKLSNLQFVYADDNMLTGSIRDTILRLPALEQLWLQENSLSGDISFFLSESMILADVYLGDNDFTGDLQDFLSFAPSSIQRLDLSGNKGLEGFISNDIGNFGSLKYFNVSSCSLEGELPRALGRMTSLETLDLSKNDFTGDFPDELADMASLASFDLSGNRDLGGDLTSTICEAVGSDLVFGLADCFGNNPRVDCDCCTDCCNREGVCGPNNN